MVQVDSIVSNLTVRYVDGKENRWDRKIKGSVKVNDDDAFPKYEVSCVWCLIGGKLEG